jgi:hypothetical protein
VGKRNEVGSRPKTKEYIDKEEPYIATKAIQDAPYQGSLISHSRQLSIGTIQPVGPYKQGNTDEIGRQVVAIEKPSTRPTNHDTYQGHSDGMNAQPLE